MSRTLLRPWTDGGLWHLVVHLVTSALVGPVLFVTTFALLATSVSLLITFPLAVPVAWTLFVTARGLARFERLRASALLDLHLLDPVPPLVHPRWFGRLAERVRSPLRWKEIAHHLLMLPVGLAHGITTLVVWSGATLLVALPFVAGRLPGGSAKFWWFEIGPGPAAAALGVGGVAGLVIGAPWATRAIASGHRAFLRRLLGQSLEEEFDATVSRLEQSRVAAVDTAEAERRRIERDLHDGAQQRLVALAVTLGQAHERFDTDPDTSRELVADAHEEAKAALRELRDLVRGIHPVILEDRGLDAALSAVVARSPIPVELQVDIDDRPPAAVESAAYYIVSEALTNVARHSGATRAQVAIVRSGDRLVVEIRDDGRGGADPSAGTGIAGIRSRAEAMAGRFHLGSPDGGPTTILVELPCES